MVFRFHMLRWIVHITLSLWILKKLFQLWLWKLKFLAGREKLVHMRVRAGIIDVFSLQAVELYHVVLPQRFSFWSSLSPCRKFQIIHLFFLKVVPFAISPTYPNEFLIRTLHGLVWKKRGKNCSWPRDRNIFYLAENHHPIKYYPLED